MTKRMTRQQFFVLLATIIGSGIVILDGSVVNLALPNIARHLHASFADLQWVVDAYALSLAALILLGGSLGDIFGRKRTYLIGLVGFGAASLLCGIAPNVALLIAARVVQGVFGALLVPGGLAIINTNFPAATRSTAIGRWAAWSGIAAAAGPLVGGATSLMSRRGAGYFLSMCRSSCSARVSRIRAYKKARTHGSATWTSGELG